MVGEMSFTILSPLMDEVSTAEKRNNSKRVATLFAKDPAILLYNGTKNQKILFALLMVHSSKTPMSRKKSPMSSKPSNVHAVVDVCSTKVYIVTQSC